MAKFKGLCTICKNWRKRCADSVPVVIVVAECRAFDVYEGYEDNILIEAEKT